MEPCLTARLELRSSPQPWREPPRGRLRSLGSHVPSARTRGRAWSWVEPRSVAPPRSAYRPGCCRPWSGLATLPLTPFIAILRGSGLSLAGGTASPSPRIAVPRAAAASSRAAAFTGPGRLPSPSAPSPCRTDRFRVRRVGSRGARHRCRCSRARGFRHCDPASDAVSPPALPRTGGRS